MDYSLGMVLYLLLTGHRPYDVEGSAAEVARIVCETEPVKPSLAGGPARRGLAGDLDTIVLTALRKEPDRRYSSVAQLSEDIRRHLEGLPVLARRDTFGYRTRKYVRRHRLAVATAAAVVAMTSTLVGFYTWQLREERDRARTHAEMANLTRTYLVDLFQISDPYVAKGEETTAREILDHGAQKIATLEQQPELQAEMMDVMGTVHKNLMLFEAARPLLEDALRIRRQLHGEEHLDVASSLQDLGAVLYFTGELDQAESAFRRALKIRRDLLDGEHRDVAQSLNDLGTVLLSKQDRAGGDTETSALVSPPGSHWYW